ncbi:hypothetical protein Cus16_0406 [Curtobacterium sp. ER1/6]|nr:hypothetical protein Cus16_0406 [Curtobacterium sp. ER1/6]
MVDGQHAGADDLRRVGDLAQAEGGDADGEVAQQVRRGDLELRSEGDPDADRRVQGPQVVQEDEHQDERHRPEEPDVPPREPGQHRVPGEPGDRDDDTPREADDRAQRRGDERQLQSGQDRRAEQPPADRGKPPLLVGEEGLDEVEQEDEHERRGDPPDRVPERQHRSVEGGTGRRVEGGGGAVAVAVVGSRRRSEELLERVNPDLLGRAGGVVERRVPGAPVQPHGLGLPRSGGQVHPPEPAPPRLGLELRDDEGGEAPAPVLRRRPDPLELDRVVVVRLEGTAGDQPVVLVEQDEGAARCDEVLGRPPGEFDGGRFAEVLAVPCVVLALEVGEQRRRVRVVRSRRPEHQSPRCVRVPGQPCRVGHGATVRPCTGPDNDQRNRPTRGAIRRHGTQPVDTGRNAASHDRARRGSGPHGPPGIRRAGRSRSGEPTRRRRRGRHRSRARSGPRARSSSAGRRGRGSGPPGSRRRSGRRRGPRSRPGCRARSSCGPVNSPLR